MREGIGVGIEEAGVGEFGRAGGLRKGKTCRLKSAGRVWGSEVISGLWALVSGRELEQLDHGKIRGGGEAAHCGCAGIGIIGDCAWRCSGVGGGADADRVVVRGTGCAGCVGDAGDWARVRNCLGSYAAGRRGWRRPWKRIGSLGWMIFWGQSNRWELMGNRGGVMRC